MKGTIQTIIEQAGSALGYYVLLVVTMRLAGKRLAGQTTTFDLIVLISIGVVLQGATLKPGALHAFVFAIVVLGAHRLTAELCARSSVARHLLRGTPRVLVRNGQVLEKALQDERISHDELRAGLRKLGHASEKTVQLATLEETGHISAISSSTDVR